MRDTDFFLRRYAKQTTSLAFLNMPYEECKVRLIERHNYLNSKEDKYENIEVKELNSTLDKKLEMLLPLAVGGVSKALIGETKSDWSVYIENKFNGTEVFNQPNYFSRTWPVSVLAFVMTPDIVGDQPGSMQFSYTFSRANEDETYRWVGAHRESRWEFGEIGEPLPFEELEKYNERRIKDRLTSDMLERYAFYFGIDLFNTDFYDGRAAVISIKSSAQSYVKNYRNN